MIRVQVRPNETLEAALRRFKRQCNYAGVFRLAKKYTYHEKRSDRRRREERERIRNIQRALRKAVQKSRLRAIKRTKTKSRPESDADAEMTGLSARETNWTPVPGAAAAAAPGAMPAERPPLAGVAQRAPRPTPSLAGRRDAEPRVVADEA
jgi:small subunit ribosomal protein S21